MVNMTGMNLEDMLNEETRHKGVSVMCDFIYLTF